MKRSLPSIPTHQLTGDPQEQCCGKVRLTLSGFSHQRIIGVERIIQALEILPNRHIARLTAVRYSNGSRYPHYGGKLQIKGSSGALAGIYDDTANGIVIYPFENPTDFYEVFYHEIGHFVFHRVIRQKDKCQWVTRINRCSPPVTGYARKNASESFAETYMMYILRPAALRSHKQKYHFFYHIVFNGTLPDAGRL